MAREQQSVVLLDGVVNDEDTHYSDWVDVLGLDRWSVFIKAAETVGAPGDITFTIEGSPDSAKAMNEGEKGDGDVLTPTVLMTPLSVLEAQTVVTSKAISAAGVALLSGIPSDAIRSIRLKWDSAATTSGAAYWTIMARLVGFASGF